MIKLLMATGVTVAALACYPAVAHATPAYDYGTANAANVCSTLTNVPSVGGVGGIVEAMHELGGLTYEQSGEAILTAVYTSCPQFMPLITAFEHMGPTPTTTPTTRA